VPRKYESRTSTYNDEIPLSRYSFEQAMKPMHIGQLAKAMTYNPPMEYVRQPIHFLLIDHL
jgi:hypothetical protein